LNFSIDLIILLKHLHAVLHNDKDDDQESAITAETKSNTFPLPTDNTKQTITSGEHIKSLQPDIYNYEFSVR
jgi:hypothetical protein